MSQHISIILKALVWHISQYGLKGEPFVEPCNYVTSRGGRSEMGRERREPVGWLMNTSGDSLSSWGKEWKYDGARDSFLLCVTIPSLSEWTLKQDEAECRKQIDFDYRFEQIGIGIQRENHTLLWTHNGFFIRVCVFMSTSVLSVDICVCVCVHLMRATALSTSNKTPI